MAGLRNTIEGWITRDGQAVQTTLTGSMLDGPMHSDASGLFRFDFRPPVKPEALVFNVGGSSATSSNGPSPPPADTVHVPLDFRPGQLLLAVDGAPWFLPGSNVSIRVQALPFRTPLHIDSWCGDVLLHASSAPPERGGRELAFSLPADAQGLCWVEAYRSRGTPRPPRRCRRCG